MQSKFLFLKNLSFRYFLVYHFNATCHKQKHVQEYWLWIFMNICWVRLKRVKNLLCTFRILCRKNSIKYFKGYLTMNMIYFKNHFIHSRKWGREREGTEEGKGGDRGVKNNHVCNTPHHKIFEWYHLSYSLNWGPFCYHSSGFSWSLCPFYFVSPYIYRVLLA